MNIIIKMSTTQFSFGAFCKIYLPVSSLECLCTHMHSHVYSNIHYHYDQSLFKILSELLKLKTVVIYPQQPEFHKTEVLHLKCIAKEIFLKVTFLFCLVERLSSFYFCRLNPYIINSPQCL